MDGTQSPAISATELDALLGSPAEPIVVDVRLAAEIHTFDRLIPGAVARSHDAVGCWWRELPAGQPVAICDLGGGPAVATVVARLRDFGTDAVMLRDGFVGWYDRGLPDARCIIPFNDALWVTRERPKIDRIACPWLIRRFINPLAEFVYVPAGEVLAAGERTGATPYDVQDVVFTHEDEWCSFDTILSRHDLNLPALARLATIVRGADTSRPDLAPQCSRMFAISLGLSANFSDDHKMLEHGMVIYDALYAWCRSLPTETRNWPPAGDRTGIKRPSDV